MPVSFPTNKNSRNGRRKAEPYGGGGASGPYTVTTNIDTTYIGVSGPTIPEEIESGGSLDVQFYAKQASLGYYISPSMSVMMGGVDITSQCVEFTRHQSGYIEGARINITEVVDDIVINIPVFPLCAVNFAEEITTTVSLGAEYTDINGDKQTISNFPSDTVYIMPNSKVSMQMSSGSSVSLYFQNTSGALLATGTTFNIEFTMLQTPVRGGVITFKEVETGKVAITPSGPLSSLTASDFTVTTG